MTGHRLHFLEEAYEELGAAYEWYAQRSHRAAAAFLREVDRGIRLIVESPDLWPHFEGEVRRCVLRAYPYSILYRQAGTAIQVIAVAHDRRRPGYWRRRSDT